MEDSTGTKLREAFVEAAPGAAAAPPQQLEAALARAWDAARAQQPQLGGSPESLARRLGEVLAEAPDPLAALAPLAVADLYLAEQALAGHDAALDALEQAFIRPAAASVCPEPQRRQELEQVLRGRLLLPGPRTRPRLLAYAGRGPLMGWVRLIARRALIDLERDAGRRPSRLVDDLAALPTETDIESRLLKARYVPVFNAALERAVTTLPTGDQTVLKLMFVENLPAATVGRMYGVSARTIQRRVAAIRERLAARTREIVREQLSATQRELDSLLGFVQSELHVTLHRVLHPSKH